MRYSVSFQCATESVSTDIETRVAFHPLSDDFEIDSYITK